MIKIYAGAQKKDVKTMYEEKMKMIKNWPVFVDKIFVLNVEIPFTSEKIV